MLPNLLIEKIVRAALEEDLGHGQDITTSLVVPESAQGHAQIIAKEDGILAGLILSLSAFSLIDAELDIVVHVNDGDEIQKDQVIAEIVGASHSLLMAERTALNFLSHLSGIATLTHRCIEKIKEVSPLTEICDTRKTLPGLRVLQKYAVRCGGGTNHRFGLDDAILIKDNHIQAAGGIENALTHISLLKPPMRKVEIEVDSLDQLQIVINAGGVDSILLDNFTPKDIEKAIEITPENIPLEASGGITLDNLVDFAKTGISYISMGALTHSAKALDISLDIKNH